jgi:MFS family permease
MCLLGGTAGLLSWALSATIAAMWPPTALIWISDVVASTIFGLLVGILVAIFGGRWQGERSTAAWAITVGLVAAAAGFAAGLLQIPIAQNLAAATPFAARVVAWLVTGSLVGLAVGLPWAGANRLRAPYALTGGLLGGTLGGLLFAGLGSRVPDLVQASSFMLMGSAVCLGIALAPVVIRYGALLFVSSGDARAQNKLGRPKREWELKQGHSYVLGNEGEHSPRGLGVRSNEIFIPDAAMAPQHAVVFGRKGRFYIARHPQAGDQAGLARYVLRVRGQTVLRRTELRDADDILLGRTALRFVSRTGGDEL